MRSHLKLTLLFPSDHGCLIVVASPTFSRVWHVGSYGLGNHVIQDGAPWHLNEYTDTPPLTDSNFVWKTRMRSYFGYPCDPEVGPHYCSFDGEDQFPGHLRHVVTCIPGIEEETKC